MINSTYRTLVAWQRAIELSVEIYELSGHFPGDERFELTRQRRRAALSVPLNIAEGRGRGTKRDYRHFLLQARGSLYEIETVIEVALRLGYLREDRANQLGRRVSDVVRPLNGLIRKLDAGRSLLAARRSP